MKAPMTAPEIPAATKHALLRGYVLAKWPAERDPDDTAQRLTADPVYGGEPELVAVVAQAYQAGQIAACVHVIAAAAGGGS